MSRSLVLRCILAVLCCAGALSVLAQDGRYEVRLALDADDDPAAVAQQLAATYRLRLESHETSSLLVISASEASVRLLSTDRRVALVQPAPVATTATGFGTYEYDGSGNVITAGADTFVYDKLGRIHKATVAGSIEQTFTYDRHGNITTIVTDGESGGDIAVGANNKLTGARYDGSGNLVSYHGGTFVYDGLNVVTESRPVGGNRHLYMYNASNERVATIELLPGGGQQSEWTLRDTDGRVLRRLARDTSGAWSWKEDYIYRGSQLLAAEVPTPEKVRHFHLDHLGTPRLITGNGGATIAERAYGAFGRGFALSPSPVHEDLEFTGHERDNFQLDYMHARYYDPMLGRFLSVDPKYDDDVQFWPQKWNRYSYVANNPLRYVDPDGRGIYDFIEGAVNGWSSSNLGNVNRVNPRNLDYKRGQMVGDAIAAIQGIYETAIGGQMVAGGGGAGLLTAGAATPVAVPMAAGGVILVAHGGTTAATALNNLASATRGSSSGSGDTPTEVTPSTNKDAFTGLRGRDARVNKKTGEVWVRDRLHKDHWEVYKNQKEYEKGNRTRSVWDDGRLKETY